MTPVDAQRFKETLKRFASGVTIVTVEHKGQLHGMTASSFASVSAEPPLILVCLAKTSQTRALLYEARAFAVNILRADQETLARAFSRSGVKPFGDLPHRLGVDGAPLLSDAIAWLECRLVNVVEAGDHDIVVGEVHEAEDAPGQPLLYYDRGYRALGQPPP